MDKDTAQCRTLLKMVKTVQVLKKVGRSSSVQVDFIVHGTEQLIFKLKRRLDIETYTVVVLSRKPRLRP
jgi:hypothetical protein